MSDLIERAERTIKLRLTPPTHELIARIRELEAENEKLRTFGALLRELRERAEKAEANLAKATTALSGLIADDHRNLVTATKAERTRIEAATIERCAQDAKAHINTI